LLSYGPDLADTWRRAAFLCRSHSGWRETGRSPGGKFPTKFEMVVNRKTAKALGLTVPLFLRALATDMIE
jgi:hypothetical protein